MVNQAKKPNLNLSNRNLFFRFKGSMKFALAGAKTEEYFNQTTVFTGDFKDPTIRQLIFAQPRMYQISVTLTHRNGIDTDESDYSIDTPLDHETLTKLIKELCHEQIYEANPDEVDLFNSFVTISLSL